MPYVRNKFNAKRTSSGGVTNDSKMEAKYAEILEWRKRAGEIIKIERQVRIPLIVNGTLICTYVADFRITLKDGRQEWHEVKGVMTPAASLKMKLAQALYPDWKWVLVKKGNDIPVYTSWPKQP